MSAQLSPEAWTCSSNECVELSIVDPNSKSPLPPFKPIFTYPIFGDSETIFGYQNLKIDLKFHHFSLKPLLKVSYNLKIPNVEVEDPQAKLLEFLPEETIAAKDGEGFEKDEENFAIPGELIQKYKKNGEEFHVYKTTLLDLELVKLHLRLQIFVLFFIEAGSYIDGTDKSWDIYLIYKEGKTIVGFCTAYNYFLYQGHENHDIGEDEKSVQFYYRKKISQFIILPPFQGQGHGQELYNCMFQYWYKDDKIVEICVEDPNESFDDLRDRCDLVNLSQNHHDFIAELSSSSLTIPYNAEWFNNVQKRLKLEKRQLQRLIEMLLLKLNKLKQTGATKKQIRLLIKKRIFWKNKDSLQDLDQPTKFDKLQNAFENLEQDYMRIMDNVDLVLTLKRDKAD